MGEMIEKGEISQTFKDMEVQNEKYLVENTELKEEMESLKDKAKEISDSLSKYNSEFEQMKKEYEKRSTELYKVMRQNKELKGCDPSEINKESEILKKELDTIVSNNKTLNEKIASEKEKLKN